MTGMISKFSQEKTIMMSISKFAYKTTKMNEKKDGSSFLSLQNTFFLIDISLKMSLKTSLIMIQISSWIFQKRQRLRRYKGILIGGIRILWGWRCLTITISKTMNRSCPTQSPSADIPSLIIDKNIINLHRLQNTWRVKGS
jgi:hypothetical protein